ncbi:MAG TPA: endonuclease [Lentisphaeria bacterium]|nr:MAG: hypothetical protein A2X48_05200 [Lentisphaerae bacterium GWF2_49_21]HBC86094.1 endonuclease [Lentisphaeria bacterium]
MRVLVYNIAYGTGAPESLYRNFSTAHRYVRTKDTHIRKIIDFISKADPDILGLVEVDTGSYRTKYVNQVEFIAGHIKHHHQSSIKYNHGFLSKRMPIVRKQANAILTKLKVPDGNFHFFPAGFKRLLIEIDIAGIRFFLVHLSVQKRVRKLQLTHLAKLAKGLKPVIIAGDFNTFSGPKEIHELQQELGLVNPNTDNLPTFPSWKPSRQLDFILCSHQIKIQHFEVPKVQFSDHLPLLLDFKM